MARGEKLRRIPHNGYLIAEPTAYTFHGCTCLIHRDAFVEVGCFDEKLRIINDVDLWYRLYAAGYRVEFLPESLVKGRIHGAQVSKSIGYSYHNPEQDMFWNRSLNWLMEHYPHEEELFFLFGRNAYLKTRNEEGDRAFAQLQVPLLQKALWKMIYCCRAGIKDFGKQVYVKLQK
jgi:GT2 family glycosyltransferase